MRRNLLALVVVVAALSLLARESAAQSQSIESIQTLTATVRQLVSLVEPAADAPNRTFTTRLKFTKVDGLPAKLLGATVDVAYQAPDRLRLTGTYDGQAYHLARDGQELWVYVPGKKFGVVGVPGVRRFSADPKSIDRTVLRPFKLPVST